MQTTIDSTSPKSVIDLGDFDDTEAYTVQVTNDGPDPIDVWIDQDLNPENKYAKRLAAGASFDFGIGGGGGPLRTIKAAAVSGGATAAVKAVVRVDR